MRPRTKTKDLSQISKACRRLREITGRTQREFAKDLQVSLPTIQRWETNSPPSGQSLRRLRIAGSLFLERVSQAPECDEKLRDDLLEIDDQLYGALVDEYPAYKSSLVASISGKILQIETFLAEIITDSDMTRSAIATRAEALLPLFEDIRPWLLMLDPLARRIRSEETNGISKELAKELALAVGIDPDSKEFAASLLGPSPSKKVH